VHTVYRWGSYDLIYSRLQKRSNHFMKADLLSSQFAGLEELKHSWWILISP
jgi:gluconokinase